MKKTKRADRIKEREIIGKKNFEYLTDPDEIENVIESLLDMLSRQRIEPLQESVKELIVEPMGAYLDRRTGIHVESLAAEAFLLAAEALINVPGESNIKRLAATWREWLLQYGYKNKLSQAPHRGGRTPGAKAVDDTLDQTIRLAAEYLFPLKNSFPSDRDLENEIRNNKIKLSKYDCVIQDEEGKKVIIWTDKNGIEQKRAFGTFHTHVTFLRAEYKAKNGTKKKK